MAKHMSALLPVSSSSCLRPLHSFSPSSQDVKRKLQFVFHLQCAPGDGGQFQVIVRLPEQKGSKGPQRIPSQCHSCGDSLRTSDAVQSQITIECNRVLSFGGLGGGDVRALINDLGIDRSLENLLLHDALYLASVLVGNVVLDRQRRRLDRSFEGRAREVIRVHLCFPREVTDGYGWTVTECRKQSPGEYLHSELAGSRIHDVMNASFRRWSHCASRAPHMARSFRYRSISGKAACTRLPTPSCPR